jgi:hypothetical protein
LKARKAADCSGGLPRLLPKNEKTTDAPLESLPVVCLMMINRRLSTDPALSRQPKRAAEPQEKVAELPALIRHRRRSFKFCEPDW